MFLTATLSNIECRKFYDQNTFIGGNHLSQECRFDNLYANHSPLSSKKPQPKVSPIHMHERFGI